MVSASYRRHAEMLSLSMLAAVVVLSCGRQQGNVADVAPQSEASSGPPRACAFTGWKQATPLPAASESHALVVVSDHLYVIGGWNQTGGARDQVVYARIGSEGTLGPWRATASLPDKAQHHGAVVIGQEIVVVGGDTGFGGTVHDGVLRARPGPDGSIAAWESIGTLPQPRTAHATAAVGGALYVLGGSQSFDDSAAPSDTVYVGTIDDAGTIVWDTTQALPEPVMFAASVATERGVWVLGGMADSGITEAIHIGALDDDGILTWATDSLPEPLHRLAAVTFSDELRAFGGGGAQRVVTQSIARSVSDSGPTAWRQSHALPEARYGHAAVVANDRVFVAGGYYKYGDFDTRRTVLLGELCPAQG